MESELEHRKARLECLRPDFLDCDRKQLKSIMNRMRLEPIKGDDGEDESLDSMRQRLNDYRIRTIYSLKDDSDWWPEGPRPFNKNSDVYRLNKHISSPTPLPPQDWVDLDEWKDFEKLSEEKLRRILYRHGYSTLGSRPNLVKRIKRVRAAINRRTNLDFTKTWCRRLINKRNSNEFIDGTRKLIRGELWHINKSSWLDFFRNRNGLRKIYNLYDKYFFDYKLSRSLKDKMVKITFDWDRLYMPAGGHTWKHWTEIVRY